MAIGSPHEAAPRNSPEAASGTLGAARRAAQSALRGAPLGLDDRAAPPLAGSGRARLHRPGNVFPVCPPRDRQAPGRRKGRVAELVN